MQFHQFTKYIIRDIIKLGDDILKIIYLVKHSGLFVDIKIYEIYENATWGDYNRNIILSTKGKKRAGRLSELPKNFNKLSFDNKNYKMENSKVQVLIR